MKIDKKRNNRQGPHRNGKDGDPEPRLEELGVANAVHPETREGGQWKRELLRSRWKDLRSSHDPAEPGHLCSVICPRWHFSSILYKLEEAAGRGCKVWGL